MTISDQTTTFFGKRIVDFEPGTPASRDPGIAYRLALEYGTDTTMTALLAEFLEASDKASLEALVIGAWADAASDGPEEFLDLLVQQAPQLPNLKALFVGDMTYEECEISWINQGDYTAVLKAFPKLQALRVRGSTGLALPAISHMGLRELTIECGGLPLSVCTALARSALPALETLELWIGTAGYGFDGDLAAVIDVVDQLRTPALKTLGLRDAEIADEIAEWIAGQAWITQLATLDLSLGTLGDVGAQALLDSPHTRGLPRLDLSHHYISQALQDKLAKAIPGVVLADPQDDDDDRYVAVGE